MNPFIERLPMWLSLGFSLVGLIVSIRLAVLVYKGVFFVFAVLLSLGILVMGFHHLIELADPDMISWSEALEGMASAVFLVVALDMFFRLKHLLSDE